MEKPGLVEGLKRGDEGSFKELVEAYQDKVYNTAIGFLQSESDAEDISQEVFIEVYRSIGKFKGDSKLSTWIYRIAVTKALELIRKRKQKKRFGFLYSLIDREGKEAIQAEASHSHPGIALENKEIGKALFAAIDKLPENQKIAFTLHKVEGLAYQQISEIMKLSISSVESLLFRAKKNLQKHLYNFYKNEMS